MYGLQKREFIKKRVQAEIETYKYLENDSNKDKI